MSDALAGSELRHGPAGVVALHTPHVLSAYLAAAGQARKQLLREVPQAFTRDEWAYLMGALDPAWIAAQLDATFGPLATTGARPQWLARPRGRVAVWLPANVSLLGPLTLLALVASGNAVQMKASSRADDLSTAFLRAIRSRTPEFARFFDNVDIQAFGRDDARNASMAEQAQVRIVFGADETARHVHALAHPLESVALSFVNRRSEAWLEPEAVTEQTLRELVQVFAIYGQAGCTSPSRVVLLDASEKQALQVQARLLELWPLAVRRDVAMHVASDNVRLLQLARAAGWQAEMVARHRGLVAVGGPELQRLGSGLVMSLVPATLQQACATLPPHIQTIGHAVQAPQSTKWQKLVVQQQLRRWVPLRRMHHFGWVWDGEEFWRQLFRWTEFGA
jgi:hypothetical protein